MIWIIIGIVVISLVVHGFKFNKDNEDLNGRPLHAKFKFILEILNSEIFDGEGEVYELHKRSFNLGATGQNQMINFEYGAGNLTITWKFKYLQKEIINKKVFLDVRNLSVFEQEKIAQTMMERMVKIVNDHKNEVHSNF
ncbi:hypothetical protein [Flavobacterium soyangense]|jgi:hypothetical protein|uniref:Uncharacterized protein n=1 Tax=Flavobacterium soyangense TaxID=2023265 RepID=A0A930U865_9FLAO|nr:hypothetical protein [Flavobacterium soyangense]MBF2707197.1 hypothetical protein [Flavobacterium soyangense]MDD2674556.1 hypothetical protein [Flavobacterium sp.]